jgi:hypothetical protein
MPGVVALRDVVGGWLRHHHKGPTRPLRDEAFVPAVATSSKGPSIATVSAAPSIDRMLVIPAASALSRPKATDSGSWSTGTARQVQEPPLARHWKPRYPAPSTR